MGGEGLEKFISEVGRLCYNLSCLSVEPEDMQALGAEGEGGGWGWCIGANQLFSGEKILHCRQPPIVLPASR